MYIQKYKYGDGDGNHAASKYFEVLRRTATARVLLLDVGIDRNTTTMCRVLYLQELTRATALFGRFKKKTPELFFKNCII